MKLPNSTLAKGVGIFALILAVHAVGSLFSPASNVFTMRTFPYLLAGWCIGWMGLIELRKLGKQSLVRSIQLIVLLFTIPVMVHPGPLSYISIWAASLVMVWAFGAALWFRRFPGGEK